MRHCKPVLKFSTTRQKKPRTWRGLRETGRRAGTPGFRLGETNRLPGSVDRRANRICQLVDTRLTIETKRGPGAGPDVTRSRTSPRSP